MTPNKNGKNLENGILIGSHSGDHDLSSLGWDVNEQNEYLWSVGDGVDVSGNLIDHFNENRFNLNISFSFAEVDDEAISKKVKSIETNANRADDHRNDDSSLGDAHILSMSARPKILLENNKGVREIFTYEIPRRKTSGDGIINHRRLLRPDIIYVLWDI
ncbi:hypothetical protein HHI36_018873 [Cryptolaemus montrouzieri]|uniref:Uncharacterized protein n=1 Tax=Cryptolaemus montrouzieri TaxID=559131 RepID=A0ABD2P220_9CUCU